MKIIGSTVAMASEHRESSYAYSETMSMEAKASNGTAEAILSISQEAEGMDYKESMLEYQNRQNNAFETMKQENEAASFKELAERMRNASKTGNQFALPEDLDMKIKMLRKILAALRGEKVPIEFDDVPEKKRTGLDMRTEKYKNMLGVKAGSSSIVSISSSNGLTTGSGSTWQKITATFGYMAEFESTGFATTGVAVAEDGRTFDFDVELHMTRSFTTEINTLEVQEYFKTDPLIINIDSNIPSVSDQKFLFDLDNDGRKDKISFAGQGSGFLTLDKNGDGIANDGSELFGTQSGDGFADLAAYDKDNNGWIDESDDVFSKLRIWMKDEKGNDFYIRLADADVGAIYLGNADTEFSLKNEENVLNAQVRKTGIYLKESTGAVGTLNHVDMVL